MLYPQNWLFSEGLLEALEQEAALLPQRAILGIVDERLHVRSADGDKWLMRVKRVRLPDDRSVLFLPEEYAAFVIGMEAAMRKPPPDRLC